MNKQVLERLSMIQSVLDTVNNHPDFITSSPALGAAMAQLQTKTNEVQSILQTYSESNAWRTLEKSKLLKTAVDRTAEVAKVLKAYARSVNDDNLYNRMCFSKLDLRDGGINGSLLRMKEVMDATGEVLSGLEVFAYDSDKFAAFTQLYNDLLQRKVAPRNAIIDHKALGESLKQELKALDDILEFQMDTIMVVLRSDNEAFYVKYRSARKTIHHGGKNGTKIPPQPDDGRLAS